MREIRFIVVHTAAAANAQGQPVYQVAKQIHDYHVSHNGWRKGGYHAIIQKDGFVSRNLEYTRGDSEIGAHAGGFNEHSLGACCTGHGDYADFTPEQKVSLADLCAQWCKLYRIPVDKVIGHRETPAFGGPDVHKTCPGLKVNMVEIRRLVEQELARG